MSVTQVQPAVLAERLEVGWYRIAEAERAGQDIAEWEEYWIGLLREYERICQQLVATFQDHREGTTAAARR